MSELEEERSEAISNPEPEEAPAAKAEGFDSGDQAASVDADEAALTPDELEQGEGVETLEEVSPVEPGQEAEMKGELVEIEEEREAQEEQEEADLLEKASDEIGEPENEIEIVLPEQDEEKPAEGETEDELEEDIEALEAEDQEAEAEALEESEAEESPAAEEPEDGRHWYVVHCYSGYENKVRHNLEQRIDTMGMKNKIFDVVVPTEEEIEVKDGKRRTVERRVFPGYILVQMLMDEDSWYVVGMGNEPTPLRPEEVSQIVKRMEAEAPRIKVTYKTGQKVRIIDGPFNDFIGTVSDIDMERAKVRVMVSFFGRETPVELDFLQVEKA